LQGQGESLMRIEGIEGINIGRIEGIGRINADNEALDRGVGLFSGGFGADGGENAMGG
jgi:hypothetical protein